MAEQQALNPNLWADKYADDLFGYAMTKSSSVEQAEDFVQETFLSALSALSNFKGNSSERTWLFAILKNKIADHYRKASTRYEVGENAFKGDESEGFLNSFFDARGEWSKKEKPKQWSVEEESLLDNTEFQKALEFCVEKLPGNWHRVITLKFLEEKETGDICKEMEISTSNYWVLIHRAKLQLRACIEKKWF